MENPACSQDDGDTRFGSFTLADSMAASTVSTFEILDNKPKRSRNGHFVQVVVFVYLLLLTCGFVYLIFTDRSLRQDLSVLRDEMCNTKCANEATASEKMTEDRAEFPPDSGVEEVITMANGTSLSSGPSGATPKTRNLEKEIEFLKVQNIALSWRIQNISLTPGKPGMDGERGEPGPPGMKGEKGDTGNPGDGGGHGAAMGIPGPPGAQGPPGRDGVKGELGAPGREGQKGDRGASGVPGPFGVQGPAGQKGDKGNIGETGKTGPAGPPGSSALKGDKGDIGAKGNAGEKGEFGHTGVPGQKGNAGLPGLPGLKGVKGSDGVTGAPGVLGQKGDKGALGAPGIAGLQGPAGQKGSKGDSGSQGSTGLPGARGASGEKGQKGEQGIKGVAGQKGDQGAQATQNPYLDLVRIVGGSRGRVEIKHNGEWGTICDDDWDMKDAKVICSMLAYTRAVAAFSIGGGTGKIWLDDVRCTGDEKSILSCPKSDWEKHNCNHGEDAGVECA